MIQLESQNSYSKRDWFIYFIFIPGVFTLLLSGLILQFLGYNVTGKMVNWLKQIPGINQTFSTSADKGGGETGKSDTVQQLQQKISDLNGQITALQKVRDDLLKSQAQKDAQIAQLQNQIFTLQKQLDQQKASANKVNNQAAVYEQMSPAKAAALLQAMPISQAKTIFTRLPSDTQAAILEKMSPQLANQLMSP